MSQYYREEPAVPLRWMIGVIVSVALGMLSFAFISDQNAKVGRLQEEVAGIKKDQEKEAQIRFDEVRRVDNRVSSLEGRK